MSTPEKNLFAREREALLLATGEIERGGNAFDEEKNRLLNPEQNVFLQEMQSQGFEPPRSEQSGGFGETLRNVLDTLNPLDILVDPTGRELARTQAAVGGFIEGAVTRPLQGLLQIPGLFTDKELVTDKAADYLERVNQGILSKAEEVGLAAGLTDKEIRDAYGTGDFIGFIAPISASVKGASILLRAPTRIIEHAVIGNLVTDVTAGAIFGGIFRPAEDLESRTKNILKESAAFGVARIVLSGLTLPFIGWRNRRIIAKKSSAEVESIIADHRNGIPVTITDEKAALSLSELLTEEGYVSSSLKAQEVLAKFQDESALVQGIVDAAEAGKGSGLVKGMGGDFAEVSATVGRMKGQFPALKFDIVKRKGEFILHFGTKGLGADAKAALKVEGRVPGQKLEKAGALYEYVGMTRAERAKFLAGDEAIVKKFSEKLKVRREGAQGTTFISKTGVTDHLTVVEDIKPLTPMEALFRDFMAQLDDGIRAASETGAVSEAETIKRLRDGTMVLTDDMRRPFDVGGAIIHPEEIPGMSLLTAEEATAGLATLGQDFGGLLGSPRAVAFEDLVAAWAKKADLPADALDSEAMVAFFGKRAREEFWKLVPEEEMGILNKLRDEQFAMVERGDIPFSAEAHSKGFTVENGEGATVILRDIMTGRRVQFGSERVAAQALQGVVRVEGDILGGSLLPAGSHGMGGFTGGFNPSDGVFTFDGTVPTREFIDDLPLLSGLRNVRDIFVQIEGQTGVPLFSKVFEALDGNITAHRNFVEPWANKIAKTWKGVGRKDRVQVAEFWRGIEGMNITSAQELTLAKSAGLTKRQIKAFKDSRELFDIWGEAAGIKENNRWISQYFGRVRPYSDRNGGHVNLKDIFGDEASIPPQFKAFFEQSRTGDLSIVELDPEIVMHRYIRTLGFSENVNTNYSAARTLVSEKTTPKIKDLPPAQQQSVLSQARASDPQASLDTPLLPQPVRKVLSEYLNIIRGNPVTAQGTSRRFAKNFLGKLGIQTDERVLDQYVNIGLSMMYGSAMGMRPSLWARNATQAIWMSYTRMGAKHGGESLRKALTQEGFAEVSDALAIRNVTAGIELGDALFNAQMEMVPVKGTGPMSMALAGALRSGLRAGHVASGVAKKMLIPYSDQDSVNRAWSYFWQKAHTGDFLTRFEGGKINWEAFEEKGLAFFHSTVKKEFARRYNSMGKESALRWIGKQGADETQFIYGVGAQPAWMQKPAGRFLGMFGTWPMWAAEAYFRRSANATLGQQTALYARTLALTGAFANMTIQSGINLWSWIAPASVFGWAGGPVVENIVQLKRVADSPLDQKADALKALGTSVGRLSFPGQVFYRDLRRSLDQDNPAQGALMMMLGRPVDSYNFNVEVTLDPNNTSPNIQSPEGLEGLRSLNGLEDFPRIPIAQLTSPVSR